jgi:flagellar assembly factor FliW
MPTITIKGNQHDYNESDIITFAEGLIGLPQIRRAVVVSMSEFEPFCWLAPLDSEETRFVVVDPNEVFVGYQPGTFQRAATGNVQTYAIVTVASDWTKTTINLRAPILIDKETRSGSQQILTDSPYHFAETLPQE